MIVSTNKMIPFLAHIDIIPFIHGLWLIRGDPSANNGSTKLHQQQLNTHTIASHRLNSLYYFLVVLILRCSKFWVETLINARNAKTLKTFQTVTKWLVCHIFLVHCKKFLEENSLLQIRLEKLCEIVTKNWWEGGLVLNKWKESLMSVKSHQQKASAALNNNTYKAKWVLCCSLLFVCHANWLCYSMWLMLVSVFRSCCVFLFVSVFKYVRQFWSLFPFHKRFVVSVFMFSKTLLHFGFFSCSFFFLISLFVYCASVFIWWATKMLPRIALGMHFLTLDSTWE